VAVRCNPFLSFRDSAREAMDFYHSVFGGELAVDTFEEFNASDDPSEKNKIMHAQLEGDNGVVLMGADTPNSMEYTAAAGISIVLSGDDEKVLRGYWDKLSSSGTVTMPLEKAPWDDVFGMCADKYGITWMVNISATAA
jgi:PhnB protein